MINIKCQNKNRFVFVFAKILARKNVPKMLSVFLTFFPFYKQIKNEMEGIF